MATPSEIRAFNLTISVREDITDECVRGIKKWITKNVSFYHCVTEQETSKRHLHAMLCFKEPKNKKKIRENLWERYVKQYHPTSKGSVAVHIQACPGRRWVDEYLQKEECVEVVCSHLPDESRGDPPLHEFFPTEEQQVALMAAKDKVCDVFYDTHETVYKQYLHDNTWVSSTETAHQYFKHRMFVSKDMRVIADSRRVHQMACALHAYSTSSSKLTNLEISTHAKEHQAHDYYNPSGTNVESSR